MRINARLDEQVQQQLDYLTQATGQSASAVVREAVARYCREARSQQGGPRRLLALVGQSDSGRSDVASDVKREVALALMVQDAALPMDLADASLVLLAEHLGPGRILSTDGRDFGACRWKRHRPFEYLLAL